MLYEKLGEMGNCPLVVVRQLAIALLVWVSLTIPLDVGLWVWSSMQKDVDCGYSEVGFWEHSFIAV